MATIRRFQYQSYAKPPEAPTSGETVTVDKWYAPPLAIVPRFLSRAHLAPAMAPVNPLVLTQAERTTPDKWLPDQQQNPTRLGARAWLEPASQIDPRALTQPERT